MNPFAKQADKPYAAGIAPEAADLNNQAKAEAIRRVVRAGLVGLGTGAGAAGLLGLSTALRPKIPSFPIQSEIDLPYPQPAKVKVAADINPGVPGGLAEPFQHSARGAWSGYRDSKDKIEGTLYGGSKGLMHGASAVPGAMLGYFGGKA